MDVHVRESTGGRTFIAEEGSQPDRHLQPPSVGRLRFELVYTGMALTLDLLAATAVGFAWLALRLGFQPRAVAGVPYLVLVTLLVPTWAAALGLAGAYDSKFQGTGSEEFQRIFNAGIRLLAVVAVVSFLTRTELARSFVAIALPLLTGATLVERYALRKSLHRLRSRGRCMRQVLVVGSALEAIDLVRHVRRVPYAGLKVVGACVTGDASLVEASGIDVQVVGEPDNVFEAIRKVRADTVAVVGSNGARGYLRRLAWSLEGSGVAVVVAPAITDVAGPRFVVRPVEGLPLLHVEEPALSGGARVLKETVERAVAVLLLPLLTPLGLIVALIIRATSPGPTLFRQVRVGKDGRHFLMLKFRTMRRGAEEQLKTLLDRNEHDGPLFKLRRDPRVTPVGRWLRRFSLDELPQLWNVLTGSMSLVGPRPPLPSEAERFGKDVHRRFLVKPGITGLWQVRGRAELSWEESIRLDLYYVENWSLALDAAILWKTVFAVLNRKGAY